MSLYEDGKAFENISATTGQFAIGGGRFGITAHAGDWGSGSLTLEILAEDKISWVTAATAITVDGTALVDLPPGIYRWAVASATGLYVNLTRVSL